jgi:PIN domain nuclease of toxin-antitoxin system
LIVLDTHAWVFWLARPDRLSTPARESIEAARTEDAIAVSAISVWEIALLASRGRLELTLPTAEWIATAELVPGVRFVAIDNEIARRSVELPGFSHPDPADRMIVATAMRLRAPVVTRDRRIRRYQAVETIW